MKSNPANHEGLLYKQWPSTVEAKQIEQFLLEGLTFSLTLKPKARCEHYENLFNTCRDMLNIEASENHGVVYTNINPYKILFENDQSDILLKLQKENIPISGDGYVFLRHENKAKKLNYYTSNAKLPTAVHSLAHCGQESALLNIPELRKLSNYAKGYGEKLYYSTYKAETPYLTEKVRALLGADGFDFKNMLIWAESVVDINELVDLLFEKSNIGNAYNSRASCEIQCSEKYAELLLNLLGNDRLGYAVYFKMFKVAGSMEEEVFYKDLSEKIRDLSLWMTERFPEKAKFLLGDVVAHSTEKNYFHDGNTWLRENLVKALADVDLAPHVRNTKAKKVMAYLDRRELMSKVNNKDKRKLLSDEFGL
jgi:hypothetical protein